jgi:hypothetical protein
MDVPLNESVEAPGDDLRARLRAAADKRGLSMATVAQRAGIGASTLNAWVNGKYAGDNEKVAACVLRWLDSLEAEDLARASQVNSPGFVPTKTAGSFMQILEHAQYCADLVVVCGEAGVGKTSACEEYERSRPNVWILTGEPSFSSAHAMLEELCEVVGVTERSAGRRSRSIISRVRGTSGLLVVDEAQHLSVQAIEQLRAIHDKGRIGLALVGNAGVYARLHGDARGNLTAQLSSRVGLRLHRKAARREDVDAILDAWEVTGEAPRSLLRAVAARPGALRGMVKTLRLARTIASGLGAELAATHVESAWKRLSDTSIGGAKA